MNLPTALHSCAVKCVCVGRDPKIGALHQTLTQADPAFNNAVQYNAAHTNVGPITRFLTMWFPLTQFPLTRFPLTRFSLNVAEFMCVLDSFG